MTACTDDERRRVAERLRRLNVPSLIAMMSILDVGGRDMCARLADLIEPPACPSRAVRAYAEEVDWHTGESPLVHELRGIADRMDRECAPVDRDALLALADEMEQKADENRLTGMMSIGRARSWADRIREALGVVS